MSFRRNSDFRQVKHPALFKLLLGAVNVLLMNLQLLVRLGAISDFLHRKAPFLCFCNLCQSGSQLSQVQHVELLLTGVGFDPDHQPGYTDAYKCWTAI